MARLIDTALGFSPRDRKQIALCVMRGASGVGKSTIAERVARNVRSLKWIDADILDIPSAKNPVSLEDKFIMLDRLAHFAVKKERLILYSGAISLNADQYSVLTDLFSSVKVVTLYMDDAAFRRRYTSRKASRGWKADDLEFQATQNRDSRAVVLPGLHYCLDAERPLGDLVDIVTSVTHRT